MTNWQTYRVALLLDGVEVASWEVEALSIPLLLVSGGLANRIRGNPAPHDELRIERVRPGSDRLSHLKNTPA